MPIKLSVAFLYALDRRQAINIERALHVHFAEYRARGEWFALPADIAVKAAREACVDSRPLYELGVLAEAG